MHRRSFNKLLGVGAAAAALPGLTRQAMAADPLKVGFIYLGPVGDFGWTYQHDVARQAAVAKYGDLIKTTYVENVPEGPDSEKVLADLASSGHKLIFATSFGYMNYVLKVAKRFPDVYWEHATGYKRDKNISTYNIRFYQGRYVQGIIAGRLSKTGLAGYVGSIPVPEVIQGMNAFMMGMRSVNPKARMKFIMVNSWYDPPKEGDAAKALMDQASGRGQPWDQGIRPIDRHGQVLLRHAAFGQRGRVGAVLHPAHRRRVGQQVDQHRRVGWVRLRHARHVALHQHACRSGR